MELSNTLSVQELVGLSEQRGGHRVSVFLPTPRADAADRQDTRVSSLLRQAEQALRADGVSAATAQLVLAPARRLLGHPRRAEQLSDGLALFCEQGGVRQFRVPLRLPETVAVGDRFLVRPLLPLLGAAGPFYVLALNQDEIRLLRGSRHSVQEMALDGLPLAVWLTMPRRRAQVHAFVADRGGTGGRAVFHGIEDDHTPLILQHFRRVDRALRDVLPADDVPLLLAGIRSTQSLYRQVNTHPGLIGDGIDGNPRGMSPEQLHQAAWPLAEPVLCAGETTAAATYRELRGTGRTCTGATAVCAAAEQGRIETLFVRNDASAGTPRVIRLHEDPSMVDHLDAAAVATLLRGGVVYAVPRDRMPDTAPMAAILRY
ncbi:hypothetical protein ODJ79_45305 [Actinoplanes sp. KI2]|uniref:baeRF3 domain-containing protein n=1 Tax=Actinoplanes sp. KI2 TaxID=2983315 RepID=UPI0021D5A3F9|nr:hypothetical protein [Actinoplanes sp. KI2]MCU7730978.1 hypothetical protein [Actinoplanes sp. KI2]